MTRLRPFVIHGVFWRQVLDWGVANVPLIFEPCILLLWSILFYLFAGEKRKAVTANLRAIRPGTPRLFRPFEVITMLWNFASSICDTQRFALQKVLVDWEFVGDEEIRHLTESGAGAIIVTAHMGNYDLGSFFFAEQMKRHVTIIRAPERDPEAQEFVNESRSKIVADEFRIGYNTAPGSLALELVDALRRGEIVAIQGDRVTPGIGSLPSHFFGLPMSFPSGPFALAMATHTPIHPLFVIRTGIRKYRVVARPPIQCVRTSRDRNRDLAAAIEEWRIVLEDVVREHWYQWFMFERIGELPE